MFQIYGNWMLKKQHFSAQVSLSMKIENTLNSIVSVEYVWDLGGEETSLFNTSWHNIMLYVNTMLCWQCFQHNIRFSAVLESMKIEYTLISIVSVEYTRIGGERNIFFNTSVIAYENREYLHFLCVSWIYMGIGW